MASELPTFGGRTPRVRRGDPITAEDFNRIAAEAVRAGRLRVGRGLVIRAGADGVTISIDANQLQNRWGQSP